MFIQVIMVEVKVIEEKGNKFVFEIEGASHSVCTALKQELWNDGSIKNAGYTVSHPYVGHPKFVIETKKGEPRKIVSSALKKLAKEAKDLQSKAKKL